MNAEVELTFVPTVSVGGEDLVAIALPYITPRVEEIIRDIVYPQTLLSLTLQGTNLVAKVFVNNADVYEFLEDVSYYLTDAQILRLGISPPEGINSVGQDTWAQGDITLDEETLTALRMIDGDVVEFIPILVDQQVYFLL